MCLFRNSTAPKRKEIELVIPLQKQNAWAKPKPKSAVENGDGPAVTTTEADAAADGTGVAKPGGDGKPHAELTLEERAIQALNDGQVSSLLLHWRLDRCWASCPPRPVSICSVPAQPLTDTMLGLATNPQTPASLARRRRRRRRSPYRC